MKRAREVPAEMLTQPEGAGRAICRLRLAEVLVSSQALQSADDDAIHSFRLACKRLRHAVERADRGDPALAATNTLKRITDELGAAHDCAILAGLARETETRAIVRRTLRDRAAHVAAARRLWHDAFRAGAPLDRLACMCGFGRSIP